MSTTPSQIVGCIKRDLDGNLLAGARYCDRIAAGQERNPWADPTDAAHYREAARRLRAEHAQAESASTMPGCRL